MTAFISSVRLAVPRLTFRRIVEAIVAADARYRQMQHLRELDDRMLRDIGVHRGDIEQELRRSHML
jgi:uncharacterized protein YjiS (DUF1127 family)